ncbi:hypothetical protein ACFSQJ_19345 [Croceitalea marina]|uniref:Uncharacterized protein n=1 Tax=Croceitalea marina TaxID=1775166 RepID=A0ABW5N4Q3_9FLAO
MKKVELNITIENFDDAMQKHTIIPFLESLKELKANGYKIVKMNGDKIDFGGIDRILKQYEDFKKSQ